MSIQTFIKELHARHQRSATAFPDKELAKEFIDGFFEFLFIPGKQRKLAEPELQKEFELYKSHLSTLVYDVIADGNKTQEITHTFFEAVPDKGHENG